MARGITEDEAHLLLHVTRRGSAGYPIQKMGRKWYWMDWRSVKGAPTAYETKRAATAAFEAFLDILIDATAGRI